MSLPEISHRCTSCGAAAREADALFCPECGKPLSSKPKNADDAETRVSENHSPSTTAAEKTPAESKETVAAAVEPNSAPDVPTVNQETIREAVEPNSAPDVSSVNQETIREAVEPNSAPDVSPATVSRKVERAGEQPAPRRGDKTRERLHRASEVARDVTRGVIEEPAKRVEKIRQASHVVIEEATYDTSLRFVLVAVGLFVVFVILLVVSKVMG
jgi:hypothetical protein